jgi:hypothetical protein
MIEATIAILVFISLTAVAAGRVTLPPGLLGTWCFDMDTTETSKRYVRGSESECEYGEVVIGPDSYEETRTEGDDDITCKAISITPVHRKYNDIYTVRYRCQGYRGGIRAAHSWLETKRMWLGKGDTVLVIEHQRR